MKMATYNGPNFRYGDQVFHFPRSIRDDNTKLSTILCPKLRKGDIICC